MAPAEETGNLLETMEKGQDTVPDDKAYNLPDWMVHELPNCRKGIWRAAIMLNNILINKEIARQGYISLTSYYEQVCEK